GAGGFVAEGTAREPGLEGVRRLQPLHYGRDLGERVVGERLAVDDAGRHDALLRRRSSCAASAAPSPAILTCLIRAVAPAVRLTLRRAMSSACAIRASSAALAAPSLGAARTRAFTTLRPSASRAMPSIASRPPF